MSGHPTFGPLAEAGGIRFRLWAPKAETVELVLDGYRRMDRRDGGWHELTVEGAGPGTLYRFRIDGGLEVPDPASRFQPQDVFGPSEVIEQGGYAWQAGDWRGRPFEEAVFLELHVGTFSPEGTYRGVEAKLDAIAEAGITAIELMPVADFAGRRNWGYDGVLLYAPDSAYGRPEELKALVDAAHAHGLMVFLDVVYNHFGPEGNFLPAYAPFFREAHTPWGIAIDYRRPEVRAFAIENALQWLRDYRFDGLRLDAVQAIVDDSEQHLLAELSRAVGALAKDAGRHIHLVLENDDNRAGLLDPLADPPAGKYRAQWNDDYHHAWHVLLTGERHGYYVDYAEAPRAQLARVLGGGFAYQGEASPHRGGRRRGEASAGLPTEAFVNFLQNHDQIGNRPFGDRLAATVRAEALSAALAITLLAPMPPLMFMGDEWGSTRPFPFFCDFTGDLAEAVRRGRRAEFKEAYEGALGDIPDALDEATFRSAVLDWTERESPAGRARLEMVRALLGIRRQMVVPRMRGARFETAFVEGDAGVRAVWRMGGGSALRLLANLSDEPASTTGDPAGGRLWGGPSASPLPPWAVHWDLQ